MLSKVMAVESTAITFDNIQFEHHAELVLLRAAHVANKSVSVS